MTTREPISWETETGLPNDVNGWITKPRFGTKDEYAAAVAQTGTEGGIQFLVDILDENNELIGSQGWSIGTGWIVSDDGRHISHPKRHNVVGSSMYGQLQNKVVLKLGVDMAEVAGKPPTDAMAWDGLGFHWMQEEHATVGGQKKTSLMPTLFLGKKEIGVTPAPAPAAPKSPVEGRLAQMAAVLDLRAFQAAALQMADVTNNDALMAQVLDGGSDGFWAKHR